MNEISSLATKICKFVSDDYALITARKRSCGKVMFLTAVCDSVHRGVSVHGRGLCLGGISVAGISVGGERVSVQGGLCQGDPPYGKERAVRILLECFPVFSLIFER